MRFGTDDRHRAAVDRQAFAPEAHGMDVDRGEDPPGLKWMAQRNEKTLSGVERDASQIEIGRQHQMMVASVFDAEANPTISGVGSIQTHDIGEIHVEERRDVHALGKPPCTDRARGAGRQDVPAALLPWGVRHLEHQRVDTRPVVAPTEVDRDGVEHEAQSANLGQ